MRGTIDSVRAKAKRELINIIKVVAGKKAYDPPLELRKNELRFLYKLRSNTTYTESLKTFDNREDQNCKENEVTTKPPDQQEYT